MIPFLDQIVMAVASNVTTVPSNVDVNFTDSANGLVGTIGTIIAIIAAILATPGVKVWFNHVFGIRKEQIDASAALVGTLANQALKSKQQIAWVIQLMYGLAPEDKKKMLDSQVAPILADIQDSINQINSVLDSVVPKVHPSVQSMLNRNTSMNMIGPNSNAYSLSGGAGLGNMSNSSGFQQGTQSSQSTS